MPDFGTESVPLDEADGRVLRQSVSAERDQPPFDRVMMDGIALRFADLASGRRHFDIVGTQHAGDPASSIAEAGQCIEIMTGAALPDGADCVIPVERIAIDDCRAEIEKDYAAKEMQFVHPRGSDHRKGHKVLDTGMDISSLDIALIASSGLESVEVSRKPCVRIVSTGNELVPAGEPIEAHQIRLSNGPAIRAMLSSHGFGYDVNHLHLRDEPELLHDALGRQLEECDVLVLSGGVSMGKADFVPEVLADLGVEKVFHRISQRPGKPMWFGVAAGGQVVFALPGNPVSALVCCRQYVLPALRLGSGSHSAAPCYAELADEFVFQPQLTCFLPVRVACNSKGLEVATPVPTNTSGDFSALSGTAGYVELAREKSIFAAGSVQRMHYWDRA